MKKISNVDFILASILTSYPDQGFTENVQAILEEDETHMDAALKATILQAISSEDRLDSLRSQYLELFDSGRGVAPLYQTEYGRQRSFFKANELAAISGFYHAFGFELGGESMAREMPDHLSVELEFYALLRLKEDYMRESKQEEGLAIVHSARRKFLAENLGGFVPAILERPGIAESESYGGILRFCDELIRSECRELDITPEKVVWVEGDQERGEITCGAAAGCVK